MVQIRIGNPWYKVNLIKEFGCVFGLKMQGQPDIKLFNGEPIEFNDIITGNFTRI